MNALLLANATAAEVAPAGPVDLLPRLMLAGLLIVNLLAVGYLFGGMLLTTIFQLRGGRQPDFNAIARAVNRCVLPARLWVWVLLVGPVALCNLFYLLYLISIGSPTLFWLGTLLPVAMLATMLAIMHRLTWPIDWQDRMASHVAIGLLALLVAVAMPMLFLMKVSPLPPVPEAWWMQLLEAAPRLVHGLLMALVMAALILAGILGGEGGPLAGRLSHLTLAQARQAILRVALVALFLQVAAGPFVLMTLHLKFMSVSMGIFLGLSVMLSLTAMLMLSADVNAAAQRVGRFLPHVMVLLLLTVLSMVMTRQFYRDKAMGPGAGQALAQAISSMEPDDPPDIRAMPGRQLYITHCNACHFSKQMAPPLTEIYALHRNDVNAIVQWAVQPGTKRAQYGPMPSQKHLGKTRLTQIAQYMLASGEHQAQAHPQQR